jgi:nicotinamidase-related amidase
MPEAKPVPGKLLLSPSDHMLIMIDFQSQMAFATKSIDAVNLRNNAGLVASAAAEFRVPTILTTAAEKTFSGPMFSEIMDALPGRFGRDVAVDRRGRRGRRCRGAHREMARSSRHRRGSTTAPR